MKRNDWILIGVVLGIISIGFMLNLTLSKKGEGIVVVSVSGNVLGTYLLSENQEIEIENHNVVQIENNGVYMKKANCPDQTCVKHKPISNNNESIICLPNRVSVQIVGDRESQMDAFSK